MTIGIAGAVSAVPYAPIIEIDFIDIEKLGIDRRNFARRALVIVIDELHGPTEHSSFCVCLLFPDVLREQRRLAIRRETSSQRHAVADLDRRAGLRGCRAGKDRTITIARAMVSARPERDGSNPRNGS